MRSMLTSTLRTGKCLSSVRQLSIPAHRIIALPKVTPTEDVATIAKWYVREGNQYEAGQPLCEIETDKATITFDAPEEGYVAKILASSGVELPVGTSLMIAVDSAKDVSAIQNTSIEKLLAPASTPSTPTVSEVVAEGVSHLADSGLDGISFTHEKISQRFAESKQRVPHFYLTMDIDLSKLVAFRNKMNKDHESDIAVLDYLLKATASAIKQVPQVNSAFLDTFVRRFDQIDINVCMSSDNGCVLPVLRDVGSKGLIEISKALTAYESTIKSSGAFTDADLSMGSFTVHSMGVFGVATTTPIVFTPQSCALTFGTIVDIVVPPRNADDAERGYSIAPKMTCTLSMDHRAIDASVGSLFLQTFKSLVENPMALIL